MGEDGNCLELMQMFECFASYLLLPIADGDRHYKPGSATTIFSSVKNYFSDHHPKIGALKSPHDDWYDTLWRLVQQKASTAHFHQGEASANPSSSVHRPILVNICSFLICLGNTWAYEIRAIMVMLYHAVGRASEIATSTWDSMVWNSSLDCVELDWRESKTGKSSMMSFFVDAESYKVCWYHAIVCYLVTTGGSSFLITNLNPLTQGAKYIFPNFVRLSDGGIASKITGILKGWVGSIDLLTAKHTSQSFKHGAADDLSYNPLVSIVAIVARGNWDYSGQVSTSFYKKLS